MINPDCDYDTSEDYRQYLDLPEAPEGWEQRMDQHQFEERPFGMGEAYQRMHEIDRAAKAALPEPPQPDYAVLAEQLDRLAERFNWLATTKHNVAVQKWGKDESALLTLFRVTMELAEAGEVVKSGKPLDAIWDHMDGRSHLRPEGFRIELCDALFAIAHLMWEHGGALEPMREKMIYREVWGW